MRQVPQDISRELRIQRMTRYRRLLQQLVRILLRRVHMQSTLQEGWADVLQMRTRIPEPARHTAGRSRRYEVAEGQRLLQKRSEFLLNVGTVYAILWRTK